MSQEHNRTRDLALVATFAGLVAALGLVPAFSPFGFPVPITLQTLGVMITGAVLGGRRAALSLLLFLALVAVGLPLLAGGRGGLGVFAGPSVGYLIGFPVAAYVIGALVWRRGSPYSVVYGFLAMVVGGIIVEYAVGIPFTAWRAGISLKAATVGSGLFVVGDLMKAVVATVVADAVHRANPGLLPARRAASRTRQPARSR
ncbi:biotin transporter [Nostocoides japonicum T1-X7]|uniref:Biotin transporter n=1 Tax=Nostocoides japonicum T1-X7 TaxID=1194083 RepID=A0A077LUX1_9MICO|nr:biotin transporter BioY [Tetrasphaera japonica]CCH77703.1 biotin transporter [Tetrasphaera japonica T1-X7]